MKKSTTQSALTENLKGLTSTKRSKKKSNVSSTRKTQTKKGKTISQNRTKRTTKGTNSSQTISTTRKARAKTSTKITIIQSRKKDLFPMMGMYKFPYRFEPMPEIQDKLNLAWFDEHYGEERMKEHIKKHKLKSHQYKAYVNYWWLKETSKNSGT